MQRVNSNNSCLREKKMSSTYNLMSVLGLCLKPPLLAPRTLTTTNRYLVPLQISEVVFET
jgi:hypothetical protein